MSCTDAQHEILSCDFRLNLLYELLAIRTFERS